MFLYFMRVILQNNANLKLNIRAVTTEQNELLGIVRMSNKSGHTKINGICMAFLTSEQRSVLCYSPNLFFYGDDLDLKENYYGGIPAKLRSNFTSYLDRQYETSKDALLEIRRRERGVTHLGTLLIPYDDLYIGNQQQRLANEVTSYARNKLDYMMKTLEKVDKNNHSASVRANFLNLHFEKYPTVFREIAGEAGFFYREKEEIIRVKETRLT